MRTARIIGAGLIGTSIGLALRRSGRWTIDFEDIDPSRVETARAMCAGESASGDVAVVIVAVPPRATADVCAAALARFPDSRALARLRGEALIASGRPVEAARLLQDDLVTWRSDARLWELLSRAWGDQGRRADAHRAAAERYVLLGSPMAAVDQLRRAQKVDDTDFYTASTIDARLRQLEPDALRELEELRQQGSQR